MPTTMARCWWGSCTACGLRRRYWRIYPCHSSDRPGSAYLVLVGLGVLAAMMIFGGLPGGLMTWLRRWGDGVITALRSGVAVGAISLGAHMLYVGG